MSRIFFLVIFIVNFSLLSGNKFNFKQLEINQGVDLVHDICRDKTGYLWITNGFQGLLSHDSYSSTAYLHSKGDSLSLSHNEVFCLHVDPFNNLWVGTAHGLNLFNRQLNSFTRYFYNVDPNPKEYNRIFQIYSFPDSSLWVVLENSISKYNYKDNSFENYKLPDELNNLQLNGIVQDFSGNIWIATNQECLLQYNSITHTYIKYVDSLSLKGVPILKKIHIDNEGDIWLSTKGEGLIMFMPHKKIFRHFPSNGNGVGTTNKHIFDLLPYKDEQLMLAVDQGGINIFDKKTETFSYYTQQSSFLPTDGLFSFWLDIENILWIGTSRHGVIYHNPHDTPFINYQFKNELKQLANNIIGCIHEDKIGNIWVGTDGEGVRVLDTNFMEIAHYTQQNSTWLNSNVIRKIEQDKNDQMLVVSWSDFSSIKSTSRTNATKLNAQLTEIFPTGTLWGVNKDTKNRFWFQLPSGEVALFDEEYNFVKRFLFPKQGFLNDSPKIIEDNPNGYLISNYNGIYSLNEDNGEPKRIISTERVSTFCINENYIAVGGMDFGVHLYEKSGQLIKKYTVENGLSSDIVKSMEFDENQKLWVATINGLNYLDLEDNLIKQYYKNDGLIDDQFFMQSILKTRNGKLYFGTYNGLVSIDPSSIKINTNPPFVYIKDISIYNDYTFENQIRNIIPGTEPIVLNWKERMFVIDFLAINFHNADKTKYIYKLEGFNSNWVQTRSDKRSATYTNLNPGLYTFTIKACNSDGVWNDQGASVQIKLKPPFWKTTVWYAMLIGVLLFLFYWILKWREYRLKREKKVLEARILQRTSIINEQNGKLRIQTEELEKHRTKLEELVEERTIELKEAKERAEDSNKLKTRFLANMSHEVRTPINAIVGFLGLIEDARLEPERKKHFFELIHRNTNSLMHFIDDIIDISQIEARQLSISLENVQINLLVNEIVDAYKYIAEESNKNLTLVNDLHDKEMLIKTDKEKVAKIVANLARNAINHTDKGNIEIGLFNEENYCVIYVKDDGPGISSENQEIIYDTFLRLDESEEKAKRGVGLGLSISKSLANLIRAELTLESEIGKGSKFMLKLPLNLPSE